VALRVGIGRRETGAAIGRPAATAVRHIDGKGAPENRLEDVLKLHKGFKDNRPVRHINRKLKALQRTDWKMF
jgi:hypothetical protein